MSPFAATTTERGDWSLAAVAGPPSPEFPFVPSPITVVMTPVAAVTFRILRLPVSAM